MREDILLGDHTKEEDDYTKLLEADSRRNRLLKIGMGTFYILLLVISLFIIWESPMDAYFMHTHNPILVKV